MPGYKCSVKERMLYSTCKAPLLAGLEEELKLEIPKKVSLRWDSLRLGSVKFKFARFRF